MSEPRVIVPDEPRYQNFLSPDYPVQFFDDTGQPINLTGVDTRTGITFVLQTIEYSPTTITLTGDDGGDWSITDAANGKASFSFPLWGLAVIGFFAVYITVQLPGESTPRAFAFNTLSILEWDGGSIVTTQVDIEKLNGSAIGSGNPFPISGPVTLADGASVTQGAKADAAWNFTDAQTTGMALLRAIANQAKVSATEDTPLTALTLAGSPVTVNATTSTTLTFSSAVKHALINNHTGQDIFLTTDGTAANVGGFKLADGQTIDIYKKRTLTIKVYGASQFTVNKMDAAANLYVEAEG
jgi:hypothetical protein